MTHTSPLSSARADAEAAAAAFVAAKQKFHAAENTFRIAQSAVSAETYARLESQSRGGPRPAHGYVPPKTAAQITAELSEKRLGAAQNAMACAESAMNGAAAALLKIENAILNAHRDALAVLIREAIRSGDAATADGMLAELRALSPPDMCVRLNQQFRLSLSVRELLDDHPEAMRIDVPVDRLRGETHGDYEALRAAILEASEAAYAATHQQQEVA